MTLPIDGVMLEPPALSTLVIVRTGGATLSVSAADWRCRRDGVTVAVFVNGPLAVALTEPVTVYVIVLPAGRLTPDWLILPEPVVKKPLAPPVCRRSKCRR